MTASCSFCSQFASDVYGVAEPVRICRRCIAWVLAITDDAEKDRRTHDEWEHPLPVKGCERCKVRR